MLDDGVMRDATRPLIGSAVLLLVLGQAALAQSPPLAGSGPYQIDLHQGAVLGSARVIGLAGAYAAVAEDTVGIPFNPASVANRSYYSTDRFDWNIAFDYLIPGLFQSGEFDFDNNGEGSVEGSGSFYALAVGAHLQVGAFGVGVYARGQGGQLSDNAPVPGEFRAGTWQIQLSAGYALLDHQLVLGGGLRVGLFQLSPLGQSQNILDQQAGGVEAGVVLRPRWLPARLGVSVTVPVSSEVNVACETGCPDGFVLPDGAALPWELRIGLAWRLGGAFNAAPPYLERQGQPAQGQPAQSQPAQSQPAQSQPAPARRASPPAPRYRGARYLLLSAEVVLFGPVDDAVGIDGFLRQVRQVSGAELTVSPRLGLETEIFARRLRARTGGYWEPSRVDGQSGRIHGTFAVELRLFDFRMWGPRSLAFASAVDVASRYSNLSLSLGFWH